MRDVRDDGRIEDLLGVVIGVGGAGSNAVNNMIVHGLEGVEFVVCNTDAQALEQSLAKTRVQLGPQVTSGLGAGAKPGVGRAAAIDSTNKMLDLLAERDADLRVLTCHHPILAPGGNRGRARTARAGTSVTTIAEHCDLVLTGHLHETFALPAEGPSHTCWFVGAGTTFSRRTRGEPAGFNVLDISADTIRVTHHVADEDRPAFIVRDSRVLPRREGQY